MSLNMRRPTGARTNPFEKRNTKKWLVDVLKEAGYKLVVKMDNVGEWNELRDFSAVKGDSVIELDIAMKGEKPNWEWMIKEFESNV